MNNSYISLVTEDLKFRRSRILLFGILGCIFISFMIGFLMYLSMHPELANNSSLLGTKASYFSETNWSSYFSLILQMIAALGLILFGFLTSWAFGREYSDRTIKDLLALPISRSSIVLAKFIIVSFWSFILSFVLFIFSVLVGLLINIQYWSNGLVLHVFLIYILTTCMTILVTTPVALVASMGKGYLAPLAYIIAAALLAQFINVGLPGLDPYVPWTIPVIFSTAGSVNGSTFPSLNILSYGILIGTSVFGIMGTLVWWNFTDQS